MVAIAYNNRINVIKKEAMTTYGFWIEGYIWLYLYLPLGWGAFITLNLNP